MAFPHLTVFASENSYYFNTLQNMIKFAVIICFCINALAIFARDSNQFIYNGFKEANLHLEGSSTVHPDGLLQLTNFSQQLKAYAFHPIPLMFSTSSPSSLSFSTTFIFAIYPQLEAISGNGIAFVLSPSMNFPYGTAGKYFGLFNASSNGKSSNHVFAVELDTIQDVDLRDINSNHVGIDVNSLISNVSASAHYYSDAEQQNESINLISTKPMQIWIDYDKNNLLVQVRMAPVGVPKPSRALLSTQINLSDIISDYMHVGFSSSTLLFPSSHYVLGWSFAQGGKEAPTLDLSKLPPLPRLGHEGDDLSVGSIILLVIIPFIVVTIGFILYFIRKKKYAEVLEDWEQEYTLQRISFKVLYRATKGFKERELLGAGGFGKVYKGILASWKTEVAVKRVSHRSGQRMREFIAEIVSLGMLRHRNLVRLLGYCRKKRELLLVYEYMPNGSLDKYLHNHGKLYLPWNMRFKIIQGMASAIVYLHEEWDQVVLHRDIKTSNVLLDADMNARLGDFGLARLYDHGTDPQTTHVVGTVGYLAPELTRKGKATTGTDVFSFGILMLEVACGRRPIILKDRNRETHLVDWVDEWWKKGMIIEASDSRLERGYAVQEIELVLKLGMFCCHPKPEARPSIRKVMQILNGDSDLPEMLPVDAESTLSRRGTSGSFAAGTSATITMSCESILEYGR